MDNYSEMDHSDNKIDQSVIEIDPSEVEMDHPDILRSLESVENPIVQDIIKQLSQFGLAVALPHTHGKSGKFLPLPNGTVAFESYGKISFHKKDSVALEGSVPVMWRWDSRTQTAGACANCDKVGQH